MKVTFIDLNDLDNRLVKKMNEIHAKVTQDGNKKLSKQKVDSNVFKEIYQAKETPSYINVRCSVHKKCRFAMWYKYDRSAKGGLVNIRWFRTINNNHDLKYHKEFGYF